MARTETPAEQTTANSEETPNAGRGSKGGVRGRALAVGSVGVALTALLVAQAEMVLSTIKIGYLQFPPVGIGLLLLVVALNRGLRRISERWGLSSSDLLVIYCMMLVAAMVSSHGVVEKLVPLPIAWFQFANHTNNLFNLYAPHIKPWMVPFDIHNPDKQPVSDWYYSKMPRDASVPWQPWIVPLLAWGFLIALVLFAFLCLTAILRRQWVDNEKLSFPLAQLPLEIAGDEEKHTFFRNPLVWMGALIPILVYSVKGLHLLQPTIPDVTLQWNLSDYLQTPPWNQIGTTYFIISFAAIGFFFLLPTDVLFSIWFFFLLTRLEQVVMISYNIPTPGMPAYPVTLFTGYQTIGAYLVLSGYFLFIARPHLARVWAAAIGREKADDADELLPYRFAFWGLFGSIAASALWLWFMGMSPWLAVFELVIFIFVTALVMSRSTAEAGMLMTETTFRPIDIYRMVAPIHALGAQNLTMLAFFDNLFLRDQRGLLLTGMLDVSRMTDGTRIRRRSFVGILALAIGLALVISVSLNLYFPYHLGALGHMDGFMEQGSPQLTFWDYANYFGPNSPPTNSAWQMPTFFSVGVVVTAFLSVMRTAFFWWPLHPLGYALSGSWSTIEFWFACLLAWVFKSLILRYGGMAMYSRARPFFLGMVIGEFGIAVLFVLLNVISTAISPDNKIPVPTFPWG